MITCSKCGGENEPTFKFCFHCGSPLAAAAPEPAPAAPAWPSNCPQCDEAISSGQRFCGSCGFNIANHVEAASTQAAPQHTAQSDPAASAPLETAAQSTTSAAAGASRGTSSPFALIFIQPDGHSGEQFPLHEGQNIVGRSTGLEMFTRDEYLAPEHALLTLDGQSLSIQELDISNGVFLRLTEPVELAHGDELRIGQERLRFEMLSDLEAERSGSETTPLLGAPLGQAWGRLVRISALDDGDQVFLLHDREHQLGRERGDILFNGDHYVSGLHARIVKDNGSVIIEDLQSSNGTFLRLHEETELDHGSLLLIGSQPFKIQLS